MPATAERTFVPKRNDETVRMDADILRKARLIAPSKGMSIAEYLSDVVHPIVDADYAALAEAMAAEVKPSKRKS